MTEQFILELPANLLQKARLVAGRAGRPVGEILVEAIERSLSPLGNGADHRVATEWSDQEVLEAAELQMSGREDERLGELLDSQQSGLLQEGERAELTALMERYQRLLLRKAEALAEAVRRGLREPVQP